MRVVTEPGSAGDRLRAIDGPSDLSSPGQRWARCRLASSSGLNAVLIRRVHPQRARFSGGMGPLLDQPGATVRRPPEPDPDILVVELLDHLPVLTPGLARALMRAITSAARAAGLVEVADVEGPEAIAS